MASLSRQKSCPAGSDKSSPTPTPSGQGKDRFTGFFSKIGNLLHPTTNPDSMPTSRGTKSATGNPIPSPRAAPVAAVHPKRVRDSQSHAAASNESKEKKTTTIIEETEEKDTSSQREPEIEQCVICMDNCTDPKKLDKCGHTFCRECIDHYFNTVKPQCPCCFTTYGDIRGNQPEGGKMTYTISKHRLPGFGQCSNGTIKISYYFPDGTQDEKHPSPGQRYYGTSRDAYLPDNREGRQVLKLLQRAFELRQTFTIGQSRTTGKENVVTWNDIHHKTSYNGGTENFGYPDPTYLNRVRQELAAKGIQ